MPYTSEHKRATRERIIGCARKLFNRRGLSEVSIDEIMAAAGLTRGGFYNHFASKDELYAEAIQHYGECNPAARWSDCPSQTSAAHGVSAQHIINAYLSRGHLEDLEWHCPMIALPSDVARAGPHVRDAYENSLRTMAAMFESDRQTQTGELGRKRSLALVALCVGGMVLARTVGDEALANEVREAARTLALDTIGLE